MERPQDPTSEPKPEPPPEATPQPPPAGEVPPPGGLYRMGWVLYLGMAVGGVVWIGLLRGTVPLALFFRSEGWWLDLGAGAAAGVGLLGVWEVARRILPVARGLEEELARLLAGLESHEAVALALLSGFAEEVFFRGAVLGAFEKGGWFWSSLLFALLHSGRGKNLRFWSLFAFLAGLVFAGLTVWSGNLLAAMVAHGLINGVNLHRLAGLDAVAGGSEVDADGGAGPPGEGTGGGGGLC